MAVENKYASDIETTDTAYVHAAKAQGAQMVVLVQTIEVASADDDGSVYRMFRDVPSTFIPLECDIMHDAITAGTDYDFGVYDVDSGAVVDKDIFADGLDLSSAGTKNGLTTVAIENRGIKSIWSHLGLTRATKKPAYDLALTGNTVGSAAGTITVVLKGFII